MHIPEQMLGRRAYIIELNYITLGEKIKSARKNKRITQKSLAERSDVSTSYISHIENGNSVMSLQVFVTIANELGVSADDLLTGNLNIPSKAYDQDIVSVFSDCSESEMTLLLNTMRSLKKSLREYDRITKSADTPNKRYGHCSA